MKKSRESLDDKKTLKARRTVKLIFITILVLTISWALLTVYEFARVSNNQDTLICFNEIKETEDEDEYSITCTGILYKYRKYYYKDSDKLSARAFTMFFKDFKRE